MKKIYLLVLAAMAMVGQVAMAQTLIDEGFEATQATSDTENFPDGWTRINSYTGSKTIYRWHIGYSSTGSTMSGHYYAACDAPTYVPSDKNGIGPRKEYLITPEVTLDDTYQLSFDWEAAAAMVFDYGQYTFQVAIIEGSDTTIIFDITNEEQVRNSGVTKDIYGKYLWTNWAVNTSKIDLSDYKNKSIKVAFIYNLIKEAGNIVYLDNISIKKHTPLTGPIAQLSETSYEFPTCYIGEKFYSEIMTVKNVGLAGLKVTGYDAPDCIGLRMDTTQSLGINESAQFQLSYKASLTSPTSGDVVLHTNGGDVTLHFTATKQAVPDGYYLELFEGNFPPAGWTRSEGINQWMASSGYPLEGDWSMIGNGYIEASTVTTPRLDRAAEGAPDKLYFTYYSYYFGEEAIPGNDLVVEVSDDGGVTFDSIWVADYTKTDTLINVTIDLSKYTTDNVYVRWRNTAVYYDSEYGMDESAMFIIDRVLLPNVYGSGGVPTAVTLVAPADSAKDVYTKNISFTWKEAQFAEGYRIYIGTSKDNWDVANGIDVGDTTGYLLKQAQPATRYYWTVIPYNSKGTATSSTTWTFLTQEDKTVREFPWTEDFENKTFAPLGWSTEGTSLTKWSRSDYYPYDGDASAMAFSNETEVTAYMYSPDIEIPAGSSMQLSFWWGNDRPVSLTKDNTQVRTNHSTAEDGIDAAFLDIWVDGDWKQVKLISDNAENDVRYWAYETVDLSEYAGKTIQLRWRYISHNYSRSRGAAVDNVKIAADAASVSFNADSWDAYKVNAADTETSTGLAMTNLGGQAVKITKVAFTNTAFTTNLQEGDELAAAGSLPVEITFTAKGIAKTDSVPVDDELVVSFSDGTQATLPVSAIALPPTTRYYGFEHDNTGVCPEGFTVINVDGAASEKLSFWDFPNNGSPLAFFVLNDSQCYNSLKEPHGHQSLMTRCTSEATFHDWIVSSKITATDKTKFEFDVRNWESVNSVLPLSTPTLTVYVSTTSATDRSTFTQVGNSFTPELFNNVSWDHLTYDLSAYAGKSIYVALEAKASSCIGAFYDNFEFINLYNFDVNNDGVVDSGDILSVVQIITGQLPAGYFDGREDVNGDGFVDSADVQELVNIITGE